MQQNVGQMVSSRFQTVELTVQHVGEGRQRIPITKSAIGQPHQIPGSVKPGVTCGFSYTYAWSS